MAFMRLHFEASSAPLAQQALAELESKYHSVPEKEADAVVALGGDGFMLSCMGRSLHTNKPVFGMNLGHIGYLMNPFRVNDLPGRLDRAVSVDFHPLNVVLCMEDGQNKRFSAFNECTMRRICSQSAHVRVRSFLGETEKVIADEIVGDGVIVSTALGSTGYYHSAGGSSIPWTYKKLGIQSICARNPVHQSVSNDTVVTLEALDSAKRPVVISGDNIEYKHSKSCLIKQNPHKKTTVLFDKSLLIKKLLLQHIR